jgi:hypothetical protein
MTLPFDFSAASRQRALMALTILGESRWRCWRVLPLPSSHWTTAGTRR